MKKQLFLIAAAILSVTICTAEENSASYLIEAEKMPQIGAFRVETHANASGKCFLHAAAAGSVCKGNYDFPGSGKYTLYLRNVSYGDNRRRLAVSVDGKKIGVAGDETPGVIASRVGDVEIQAGKHEITLVSCGDHARFDALLFVPRENTDVSGGDAPDLKNAVELFSPDAEFLRGDVQLHFRTDAKPFAECHCGNEIIFRFHPACDGKALTKGFLLYRFRGDDGQDISGKAQLDGNEIMISTKLAKPGFVWCYALLGDESGGTARCIAPDGKFYDAEIVSGVGADEEKIPQIAEPDDFDSFWTALKKELDAVPVDASVKEVPGPDAANYKTFEVSVACAGPRPATGYLLIPRDAAEKSLPAEVGFQGYGLHKPFIPKPHPGKIYFEINAHGMPLGRDNAFYQAFLEPLRGYAMHDGADAQTCYFHQMAYRVLRALQFVRTLPEWDGKNLVVSGGSQGGMQSLWAAAQDEYVTYCRISVPWNCNLGGETLGLIRPVGCDVEYFPDLRYYDSANHAKRVKCPVDIFRAGLRDTLCPPAAVARMYHNLSCPKRITWIENNTHFAPLPGSRQHTFQSPDFPSGK